MPAISINMNLNQTILGIYPVLVSAVNTSIFHTIPYQLQDNTDGLGPYIVQWNNANPKPTPAQTGTTK